MNVNGTADKARVRRTGLAIASAIVAAWLVIHVGAIFFWPLTLATVPAAVIVVLVQTWLSTGLFIVAHDAMHGALAPGRPAWNRRVGTIALMLYAGLSYRQLLPNHARHHHHAGTDGDPDFHAANPRALLPWFGRFFAAYYTHGQFLRITAAAIVYVLVLGATLTNVLLFWALPAVLALGQLFVFGTWLPHRHGDDGFADRHNARSTRLSDSLSLLTCFHFGGYHHEHHLSPGTPWWRLPAFRRERGERAPR